MCKIRFETADRLDWIRVISGIQQDIAEGKYDHNQEVCIEINEDIVPENIHPVHIVLLACLIKLLRNHNCAGNLSAGEELMAYFIDPLHLDVYFTSDEYHVRSESNADLNLWNISAEKSLFYSHHVSEYLKKKYFCNKDLSLLKVVLDELYANVSDHSHAGDLAYSYIHYDEASATIRIAFCDFGIGIPRSLEEAGMDAPEGYIMKATGKGVSAKSNTHNKGFGLDIVVSSITGTGTTINIVSGDELFVSFGKDSIERTWPQQYYFNGTLISFDMPIEMFEDVDYVGEFEF